MTRHLTAGVLLLRPPAGDVEFLPEGSALPDWAVGLVGDHVLTGDPGNAPAAKPAEAETEDEPARAAADDREAVKVPPRHGKGSGRDAWADYADAHGVDVSEDMDRGGIIAALEAAGKPVDD